MALNSHPTQSPDLRYASVLVDAGGQASRSPFDYLIPSELASEVAPGRLVVVPFGRRLARGLVVALKARPSVAETRPIREIYAEERLADPLAPDLAAFVASRYACSLIEAYRAVLPGAIGGRPVRVWTAADPAPAPPAYSLDSQVAPVYHLVLARGSATTPEICRILGLPAKAALKVIKRLQELGLLTPESKLGRPPVRPQVQLYAVDEVAAALELPSLARRAPRQAELLEAILSRGGPVSGDEIAPGPGPRRALRALEARGLLVHAGRRQPEPVEGPVPGLGGEASPLPPTPAQAAAVDAVAKAVLGREAREFLLFGVTGSGKTEVYMQAMAVALEAGRQALVLVPEISLTPQAVTRFEARFRGKVAVLHSRLPAGERSRVWRQLASGSARIAIGPRSAVFAPLPDLGLIVIDEEHEPSYKQEDVPRYDARAVAAERARLSRAPLLYGSATPSMELFHRAGADAGSGTGPVLLELPERLDGSALPEVVLVNMRDELSHGNRSIFSRRLQVEIAARLNLGEQVILFLNRRGLATFVLCRDCGHVVRCPNCDVSLVYHGRESAMCCHYCGYETSPPQTCPACASRRIRYFGTGTERVEAQARAMFPEARIARLDFDVASRRGAAAGILGSFARGEIDILVGTQIIGKGMDVPAVTLVGVIAADTALALPDFRAAERSFSLITQVAGRAGRGKVAGLVLAQTYCPEHYALRHAAAHDYRGFYREELEYRRALRYPPFVHLALIRLLASSADAAEAAAGELCAGLLGTCGVHRSAPEAAGGVELLGPSPSPFARLQGQYRWNIVLKSKDPFGLARVADQVVDAIASQLRSGVRVAVDIDPQEIL